MAAQKQLKEEELINVSGGFSGAAGGTEFITYVLTFKTPSGEVRTREFNGLLLYGSDSEPLAYNDAYRQAEQFLKDWGFTFVDLKKK